MSHGKSLIWVSVVIGIGVIGYATFRGGLGAIEFGGAQTGTVIELEAPAPEWESEASDAPPEVNNVETSARFSTPTVAVDLLDESQSATRFPRTFADDDVETVSESPRRLPEPRRRSNASAIQLVSNEEPDPKPAKPTIRSLPLDDSEPSAVASDPPEPAATDDPPVRIANRPDENSSADLATIDRQIKAGQIMEAHKALSKLYWQQPDLRSRLQERIDGTANAIFFSSQPHVQEPYVVQSGDQLRKIAAKHNVSWQYLARLNRLDPKRLRAGQKLKVIDGPFGAVVTLSDFELVLHHRGQYVRSYRVCIGKNNSTPVGKFKVLNKVVDPQYTDPDGKVIAGGKPNNPLGNRWLDLGDSYGIHGTIEPESIGKAESRGCVRMINDDVAEVYDLLEVGSEVIIRP